MIVDKIIQYESTSPDEKPWYKKMIAVSGKNFAIWQGQSDGEFLTDRAIENMSGRIDEVVRIYATNNLTGVGPVPDTEDIVNEFSKGAGFVDFEGHGNPISWSVIEADGEYESNDWHGGINIKDFLDLSNGDKLPIVMVGGCHNGLFNVSILQILLNRRFTLIFIGHGFLLQCAFVGQWLSNQTVGLLHRLVQQDLVLHQEVTQYRTGMVIVMVAALVGLAIPAAAQDKPVGNMQILRDKIKADKKLLVAANMELTESEAKGFWPVYDEYQQELANFNQRIVKLIESYAAAYRANTMTDEAAKQLIAEFVAIGKGEAAVKGFFVPKLSQVLPPKKVARYFQIENKIRAALKYELAGEIPLVP